jgi:uncharacterized protein with PQ loop repeat
MLVRASKRRKDQVLAIAFVVAVIQPLTVLPQVIQIFSHHSAAQVSLLTWALLTFFNAANLIYGLIFEIKPLILGNALWVIVDAIVVVGILIYR